MERASLGAWSKEDDELLRLAVYKHGDKDNWKNVALEVPGRTNKTCRKRWLHSLSPSLKKSAWTAEEDSTLIHLYSIYGTKWSAIARHIPGRTDDGCAKRYRESLDPKLKKDMWTPEEDTKLLETVERIGASHWKQVGQALERSSLGCRNRFRLLERRRKNQFTPPPYYPPEAYGFSTTSTFRDPSPPPILPTAFVTPFQSTSSSLSAALSDPPRNPPSLPALDTDYATSSSSTSPSIFVHDFTDDTISSFDHSIFNFPDFLGYTDPGLSVIGDYWDASSASSSPFDASASLSSASVSPLPYCSELPEIHPSPVLTPTPFGQPQNSLLFSATPSDKTKSRAAAYGLSCVMPVTEDPTVVPYACGYPPCWPTECFRTSKELYDHNKTAHPEPVDIEKPFRCALQGCEKSWKSLNGLQYHLQVSTVHFTKALSSQLEAFSQDGELSSPGPSLSDATDDIVVDDPMPTHLYGGPPRITTSMRTFLCDVPQCFKAYKHASGLRYHMKHGHPRSIPAQLTVVPPSVKSKQMQTKRSYPSLACAQGPSLVVSSNLSPAMAQVLISNS